MKEFYNFVTENFKIDECFTNNRYCSVGHSFCMKQDKLKGIYWYYEGDNFTIDIHDIFIEKEIIHNSLFDIDKYYDFYTAYLLSANGECFTPYQNLSHGSLYVVNLKKCKTFRFIHHPKSHYLSVGIYFRKCMLDEYLTNINSIQYEDMFFNINNLLNKPFDRISKEILNCKMVSPAAEIFFESKAKEWLSITVDAFLNTEKSSISLDDDIALNNVTKYIDDHYASPISQTTLEKIAMMSGTKLKRLFKQKHNFTISEYIQRRRMNMAEHLIINSTLKLQDIALAVGYTSHSKFSACFKKHKGVYPKDIKKYINSASMLSDCFYDK